jgi:hypothetical protein
VLRKIRLVRRYQAGGLSRWRQAGLALSTTVAATAGVWGLAPAASEAALPPGCSQSGEIVSCTYTYTSGSNPFTVPAGVSSIHVVAVGAAGAGLGALDNGGRGATVSGDLSVTGDTTLYAVVGANAAGQMPGVGDGGGSGGGGFDPAGAGGGASDVRTAQNDLSTRLLVAAGGGGAGGIGAITLGTADAPSGVSGAGGAGGGNNGSDSPGGGGGAGGATPAAGGTGGAGGINSCIYTPPPFPPVCAPGTPGAGGDTGAGGNGGAGGSYPAAGLGSLYVTGGGGGGGGGGWFGGGGGGGGGLDTGGGGGGGGSNLVPAGGSASVDTTGVPMVQVSYELVPTSKAQCKDGGWRDYPQFTNQGQCVSFVETGK